MNRHRRPALGAVALVAAMAVLAAGCYDSDNGRRGDNTTAESAPVVEAASTTTVVEGGDEPPGPDLAAVDVQLTEVAELDVPIAMASRTGTEDLYVAERAGLVRVLTPGDGGFGLFDDPLIDISEDVVTDGERGLLGLTFSPDGTRLYLSYSNADGDSRVVEYQMDGDAVDEGSRRELVALDDPYSNHNGGEVVFGPDGFLYVAFGDGGLGGDPLRSGQDPTQLFGKILRIDPSAGGDDGAYGIPADNPFADAGGRPEVFLYGVRNPWRFSFDRATGDLWIGEVGQNIYEEIDYLPADDGAGLGANLGWNQMEGLHPYEGATEPENHTPPILEYSHDGGGCAVTGGYVYRGEAIPALQGAYVWGDYCLSEINALVQEDGEVVQEQALGIGTDPGTLISFGQDADGELYVLSSAGGVYRIDPL